MSNVEFIFPKWKNARNDLKNFVDGINGFKASMDRKRPGIVNISFNFPHIKDKDTGKKIPLLDTFPTIYQEDIKHICYDVLRGRIPSNLIEKWRYEILNDSNMYMIENELYNHERESVSKGNMSLKEELAKRFGIFIDYYKSKWNLK